MLKLFTSHNFRCFRALNFNFNINFIKHVKRTAKRNKIDN